MDATIVFKSPCTKSFTSLSGVNGRLYSLDSILPIYKTALLKISAKTTQKYLHIDALGPLPPNQYQRLNGGKVIFSADAQDL